MATRLVVREITEHESPPPPPAFKKVIKTPGMDRVELSLLSL